MIIGKRFLVLLFKICLLLFYSSCRTEECEGFPKEDLINIPYLIGDTLKFENGNDTINFVMENSGITEPYDIVTRFPADNNDDCEAYGYFRTSKNLKYGYEIEDGYGYGHIIRIESNGKTSVFIESNTNVPVERVDTLSINSNIYTNVIILKKDPTVPQNIITSVTKSTGIGIIQFVDNQRNIKWNRILK